MNRLESFVHNSVKRYPHVKDAIRTTYQAALFPWIGRPHTCDRPLSSRPQFFFGFHDKTPWCPDNRRVLAHRSSGVHEPDRGPVEVGYFTDSRLEKFVSLGHTDAWSKQQGSQLQWCGRGGSVIYNAKSEDGSACSVLVEDGDRSVLDYPIAAVDSEGRHGCVVEFGSFGVGMEGYGYGVWSEEAYRERRQDSKAVGLTELDLSSGHATLHLELQDVASRIKWPPEAGWHSFISHPQYSPNGSQIAFFLRRAKPNFRVQSRMCVYDRTSGTLTLMESGTWLSHYCWLDEDQVLVYLETARGTRRFDVLSSRSGTTQPADGLPSTDGHPQFSRRSGLLVLDSYADRRRRQALGVYQRTGDSSFTLVEAMRFYSPLSFRNEDRVDLHPRWDREGRHICIDSSFGGQRALTVLHGS
jgi:hypothetical protein